MNIFDLKLSDRLYLIRNGSGLLTYSLSRIPYENPSGIPSLLCWTDHDKALQFIPKSKNSLGIRYKNPPRIHPEVISRMLFDILALCFSQRMNLIVDVESFDYPVDIIDIEREILNVCDLILSDQN